MNKYESILNNQFDVYIYHSCLQKRQSTFQEACWQHFSNDVTVGVRSDNISVWLSKEKIQINESTSSQSVKERTSFLDSCAFEYLKTAVLNQQLFTIFSENYSVRSSGGPKSCLISRNRTVSACVEKSAQQYQESTSALSSSMLASFFIQREEKSSRDMNEKSLTCLMNSNGRCLMSMILSKYTIWTSLLHAMLWIPWHWVQETRC